MYNSIDLQIQKNIHFSIVLHCKEGDILRTGDNIATLKVINSRSNLKLPGIDNQSKKIFFKVPEQKDTTQYNIKLTNSESLIVRTFLDEGVIYSTENIKNISIAQCIDVKLIPEVNFIEQISMGQDISEIDSMRVPLPLISQDMLSESDKGLWEFYGIDEKILNNYVKPRNPVLDIQSSPIAIDFGTSSTVVAYEDKYGLGQLIRVGGTDFWEAPKLSDYENPTILEFIDFEKMLEAWQTQAYRPAVLWNDVRGSHEALHNFRNNETDLSVVASMMTKLKHWALKQNHHTKHIIKDRKKGFEFEIQELQENNPVRGVPLSVSKQYNFDPIELYAWMLGMLINWRGRGIYLNYYLTFPVDYPRDVKDKILSSFRRGLQRSLPETLTKLNEFNHFSVEERASEPAAFAAIAIPTLNLEPNTPQGLAYAVFDFGGGTSDFDFGFYRHPTDEEADDGYDRIFEHFGAKGDKYLGGENILENLAYQTFIFPENLKLLREKQISFTRPLDVLDSSGNELLVSNSQAAQTNTLMLMSQLRRFWETGESLNSTGIVRFNFLSSQKQQIDCELVIPEVELFNYIESRIFEGLQNFYSAMKLAFSNVEHPEHIHILLAGNASQSKILQGFLGLDESDIGRERKDKAQEFLKVLWPKNLPGFTVHAPLNKKQTPGENVNIINAKTGVALGLLKVCPGSTTKLINRSLTKEKQGHFAFNVGRIVRDQFEVKIKQGEESSWCEIGKVIEQRFRLAYSSSPRALVQSLKLGEADLSIKLLSFAGDTEQHKVFAKPDGVNTLILATALSFDDLNNHALDNIQHIDLTL